MQVILIDGAESLGTQGPQAAPHTLNIKPHGAKQSLDAPREPVLTTSWLLSTPLALFVFLIPHTLYSWHLKTRGVSLPRNDTITVTGLPHPSQLASSLPSIDERLVLFLLLPDSVAFASSIFIFTQPGSS